jgi:selenocysteine lyase/cysteine desulfurase
MLPHFYTIQELTAHLFRRLAKIPELKILSPQSKADGRSA